MAHAIRIQDVDCTLLDVVLALSFDTEELVNCCLGAGAPVRVCRGLPRAHAVRVAVHHACHGENALARMVARRLDYVHAAALREHGGWQGALSGGDLTSRPALAAGLWGLARDGSDEAAGVRRRVAASVAHTGYDLLAREVGAVSAAVQAAS